MCLQHCMWMQLSDHQVLLGPSQFGWVHAWGHHEPCTVQVGVLDTIYQKSLRLSVDARNARGVGAVVNLQSNDASKVWMMPTILHMLWNGPFQVCAVFQSDACVSLLGSVWLLQQLSRRHICCGMAIDVTVRLTKL